MSDLNTITITGRIGRDPETRYMADGTACTSFSVACNRWQKDASGKNITDWFRCTAWRKTGEIVGQYYHKGDKVAVTGRMQSRQWEDQSGNKRENWDLVVEDIVNHQSRSQSEQGGEVTGNGAEPVTVGATASVADDDHDPFATE